MSGKSGPGKVATSLFIILFILLVIFLAQFLYVLWRRRMFRRRQTAAVDLSPYSPSEPNFSVSKDLLYFFCVSPSHSSLGRDSTAGDLNSDQKPGIEEIIDIDLLKIHGKFLFAVKEEEKDAASESPAGKSLRPIEVEAEDHNKISTLPEIDVDDATPFSTPCGSPLYFTPTDSPVREDLNSRSGPSEVTFTSK